MAAWLLQLYGQPSRNATYAKTPLYLGDGRPAEKATYWRLLPWLKIMLADPNIGAGMVAALKEARAEAAAGAPKSLRDWFDGTMLRTLGNKGNISTNTCIALSISMDGFQAWKQRGFVGRPINATVLKVLPSASVQVVSQLIVGSTPRAKST